MHLESRRFVGPYEIKPGARIPYSATRLRQLYLDVVTVCDQVQPDRWHAEVTLLGQQLLRTTQFDTDDQAAREAERLFIEKVAALCNS
jgi:hypothetical protein